MRYCKKCNKEKEESVKFCDNCGNKLNDEDMNKVRSLSTQIVRGILFGLISFFVISFSIVLLTDETETVKKETYQEVEEIQEVYDFLEVPNDIMQLVELAENEKTKESVENARIVISQMDEGDMKKKLDIRLDAVLLDIMLSANNDKNPEEMEEINYLDFIEITTYQMGYILEEWAFWCDHYENTSQWVDNVSITMDKIMNLVLEVNEYEAPIKYREHNEQFKIAINLIGESVDYYYEGIEDLDSNKIDKSIELMKKSSIAIIESVKFLP